jgi:hypothetical protein
VVAANDAYVCDAASDRTVRRPYEHQGIADRRAKRCDAPALGRSRRITDDSRFDQLAHTRRILRGRRRADRSRQNRGAYDDSRDTSHGCRNVT